MCNRKQALPTFQRAIIAVFSFVLFAGVGFGAAVILSVYSLWPGDALIWDALPLMLGCGSIAALLAYRYPRVFNVLLWFMP